MQKKHLASLVALMGLGMAAQAQPFSQTYFIGDSLSDSGQFGARFTTNPGQVWAQVLANRLGTSAQPSSQGGSNYAVGGARVGTDGSTTVGGTTVAIPSMVTQSQQLRAQQGGRLDSNALYTVWGGANDLFAVVAGADAQTTIGSAIVNQVTTVSGLAQNGANYILVPNIPDLGMTPAFAANQAAGSQLSTAYNQALYDNLAKTRANVIPLNVAALLSEAAQNPKAYGFKNVTMPACGAVSSLQCTPANWLEKDADQTYLFADGVHPTTAGHKAIADYAEAVLTASSQMAVLAPAANQAGVAQMQSVDRRLQAVAGIQDARVAVWGQGAAVVGSGDGLNSELDGTGGAWMLGVDKRVGDWTLGTYLGHDSLDSKTLRGGSSYEQQRLTGGLYGRWQHGNVWVNGQLYYADLDVDTTRRMQIAAATREHRASANGSQYGAKMGAGLQWQHGALTHGPLVGLSMQKATIKRLDEDQAQLSTSMAFDEQEHESLQSSLGYQAAYQINPQWQAHASAQWQHEFKDADQVMGARLQTVSNIGFNLPVDNGDAKNSGVLEVGVNGNVTEQWQIGAGVSAQVGDAPNAQTALYVNTAYRF